MIAKQWHDAHVIETLRAFWFGAHRTCSLAGQSAKRIVESNTRKDGGDRDLARAWRRVRDRDYRRISREMGQIQEETSRRSRLRRKQRRAQGVRP